MNYHIFTEVNDQEGEEWSRFIPETDPLLDELIEFVNGLNSEFFFFEGTTTEEHARVLVEHSDTGYTDEYAFARIRELPDDEYDMYKLSHLETI